MSKYTKLSEEYLYDRLDMLSEDSQEFKDIDAELDRRAEIYNKEQELVALIKKQQEEEKAQLIQEFEAIQSEHNVRIVCKAMVIEFGDEFIDNYHISDHYTVTSLVASNNINSWECEDRESALNKVNQLVYYRVYDKYFRDGPTDETLLKLKSRIMTVIKDQIGEEINN